MVSEIRKSARCVENGRLVYYNLAADGAFWDGHWNTHINPEHYDWFAKGNLGYFEDIFPRWLPREGRILEGGCGPGYYVLALRALGYDAEGVDFASETVKAVKRLRDNLPIKFGDVTALDVPDNIYSGYVSLGVVEHEKDGPEAFLKEAMRILKPGGVAVVSVPWFHPLRRRKAEKNRYDDHPGSLEFYQYAFTEEEFTSILEDCGFEILHIDSYDPLKGLKDEVPFFARMRKWPFLGRFLLRLMGILLNMVKPLGKRLGHMLVVVARKPEAE